MTDPSASTEATFNEQDVLVRCNRMREFYLARQYLEREFEAFFGRYVEEVELSPRGAATDLHKHFVQVDMDGSFQLIRRRESNWLVGGGNLCDRRWCSH